jgi:undecaprenyl-diphosphatase
VETQSSKKRSNAAGGITSPARRFELKVIGGVAVLVAGLAFAALAMAALGGRIHVLDTWLLNAFRSASNSSDPLGAPWFEELVRDISALGSTIILTLAVLAAAGYLYVVKARQKAAFLILAVSAGTLLNRILKLLLDRPRPDVVEHGAYVANESFPSGHAANSAIVYLTLGMMLARVEASYAAKAYIVSVCVLLTLLIGLTRIYLGVHWPSDVIAGWMLGICWALLTWYVLIQLQPSGTRS